MMISSDYLRLPDLDHQSDRTVLEQLRQGQLLAFDVLFQRYGVKVYSVAYAILADAHEAEAVTRQVFASLWKTEQQGRDVLGRQESLESALMTLTRSHSLACVHQRDLGDRLAKFWRSLFPGQQSSRWFVPSSEGDEDGASGIERARNAEQLLATLSRKEREVLSLVYAEATTVENLAKRLHIPHSVAKYRARKALTKLHHHRVYVV